MRHSVQRTTSTSIPNLSRTHGTTVFIPLDLIK